MKLGVAVGPRGAGLGLDAPDPLGHRVGRDAERRDRLGTAHLPREHAPRHLFPAQRRQTGVLAHLHAVSTRRLWASLAA